MWKEIGNGSASAVVLTILAIQEALETILVSKIVARVLIVWVKKPIAYICGE